MKKIKLLLVLLTITCYVNAQVSRGGKPYSFTHAINDNMEARSVGMPRLDVAVMRANASAAYRKGEILQAGQILPAHLSMTNSGVWTDLPNGDRIWRLKIDVPDAPATSLYYDDFYLPEGARLYVYNDEKTHVIGAYTSDNNSSTRLFATEIVYTGATVLEYYEPAAVKGRGSLTVTGVSNVFNAPEPPPYIHLQQPKCCGFGTSGSCNVNVNCPEGASWTNQRNSVARILIKNGASQGYCSGALVNNTAQDCKNYFLTANHCGAAVSAADKNQWIFYFNYQSAGCTNGATEPASNTITGCTMRASSSNGANSNVFGSDFLLVEFNGAIPASYNVYYAGWDASGTGSNSGVSIHHPAGDIKKISTYTAALTSRRYYSQLPDNSHWQANWVATATNHSITEGGSSGSPLFNASGNIVGKLSGGPSFCTAVAADKNDYYGKISYDWTSNGTAASHQLKPWLAPGGSVATSLAGRAACSAPPGCPDIQEPNNTQATAGTIVPGTTYKALIATATDNDYYKFTTTGTTTINVSLTTLPFDYELQLLNAAGTVLASSTAGGTTNEAVTLANAAAATYTVRVFGYNGAFSASNCYTLLATVTSACGNTPEPNETLATASAISANTDVRSQIASATDVDWYRFTNTAAAANINILLSNLPGDYDVYLYNSAGTLLGSSTAGSTTNESIIYNTATVGTYYVRVIGYNGVSSTSVCYLLRANTSATPKFGAKQADITKLINKGSLLVSPNPAQGAITLGFDSEVTGSENLTITDLMGRVVMNRPLSVNKGKNQMELTLPATLAEGVYSIKVGTRPPVKLVKE
jgi:Bacterial pre-peptidase C-terminal domain/Secretion system C-terminal sorting domain